MDKKMDNSMATLLISGLTGITSAFLQPDA